MPADGVGDGQGEEWMSRDLHSSRRFCRRFREHETGVSREYLPRGRFACCVHTRRVCHRPYEPVVPPGCRLMESARPASEDRSTSSSLAIARQRRIIITTTEVGRESIAVIDWKPTGKKPRTQSSPEIRRQ